MSDPKQQPDFVELGEGLHIQIHGNAAKISKDHSFIIDTKKTPAQFFADTINNTKAARLFWHAAGSPAFYAQTLSGFSSEKHKNLSGIKLGIINVSGKKGNITNSKQGNLHLHAIDKEGDLGHITKQRTPVPHPNFGRADTIDNIIQDAVNADTCARAAQPTAPQALTKIWGHKGKNNSLIHLNFSPEDGGESQNHEIIVIPGYERVVQMAGNAPVNVINDLSITLARRFKTASDHMGMRAVFGDQCTDGMDTHKGPGMAEKAYIALHLHSGEDLGQVPGARWLQDPAKLAPK